MHDIELVVGLLILVTALALTADRLRLPYPILLVLAGSGIGLVPGLPHVALAPDLVFFVFLPPLLYSAAWQTSWPDFKEARRPIGLLALGCVLFTTTLVAVVAHYALPGFSWATAFVLGAIVSPPDAVAAASALRGLPVPRRVLTVLEGESLVNDASGLIAYRYAVAAVLTGQFALGPASLQLVWVAAAGVAVGWALAWVLYHVHRRAQGNAVVETSLTLLTPYLAYLAAEELHVSGVLAVVTTGLVLSRHSARLFSINSRLPTYAVWNTVVFVLNGVVFILIGLQLPTIIEGIGPTPWPTLLGYAGFISFTVVLGRLLWVYPATYLPRWLSSRIRERELRPPLALATVVGWAGMRGVVSLAAALALPLTLPSGAPFPQRNLILLLTFAVIFVTLVLQGLSLPWLIRRLGIRAENHTAEQERALRLHLATQTCAFLNSPAAAAQAPVETLVRMQARYEHRLRRLQRGPAPDATATTATPEVVPLTPFQQLQEVVIGFERNVLDELRKEAHTTEDLLRKLENELDLEEARLTLDKNPG